MVIKLIKDNWEARMIILHRTNSIWFYGPHRNVFRKIENPSLYKQGLWEADKQSLKADSNWIWVKVCNESRPGETESLSTRKNNYNYHSRIRVYHSDKMIPLFLGSVTQGQDLICNRKPRTNVFMKIRKLSTYFSVGDVCCFLYWY